MLVSLLHLRPRLILQSLSSIIRGANYCEQVDCPLLLAVEKLVSQPTMVRFQLQSASLQRITLSNEQTQALVTVDRLRRASSSNIKTGWHHWLQHYLQKQQSRSLGKCFTWNRFKMRYAHPVSVSYRNWCNHRRSASTSCALLTLMSVVESIFYYFSFSQGNPSSLKVMEQWKSSSFS